MSFNPTSRKQVGLNGVWFERCWYKRVFVKKGAPSIADNLDLAPTKRLKIPPLSLPKKSIDRSNFALRSARTKGSDSVSLALPPVQGGAHTFLMNGRCLKIAATSAATRM